MKPLDWPLLADENINSRVVSALRDQGRDVAYCRDSPGQSDREVLLRAESEGRVVLTHDANMGTLVLRERSDVIGVICLRPAHIKQNLQLKL